MSDRKPKQRRPLVEPGSVLGDQSDILSSVLSDYAQSTGQPEPVMREAAVEPPTVDEEGAGLEEAQAPVEAKGASRPTETARQQADKPARQTKAPRARKPSGPKEDAEQRAQTPKRLCSYRIPEGLDDWLEEEAFRNRHAGVTKQDLVAQGIQLLIVARAAHEPDEDQS